MPWTDWLVLYGLAAVAVVVSVVVEDVMSRYGVRYERNLRLITEEEMEQELDDIRLWTYRSIPLALVWPIWVVGFLVEDYRRVSRDRQQSK